MLILTLLLVAASGIQCSGFSPLRFSPKVAKLISVECNESGMNVSFGQKLTVSFLKQEQDFVKSLDVLGFSLGTVGTCMGEKYENGSYWETSGQFSYFSCGMKHRPFSGGMNYTTTAIVLMRKARYYEVPISCSILDKPIRETQMFSKVDEKLVPLKVESIRMNSHMQYGFTVNSTILPNFKDLYTYPINCAVNAYPNGSGISVLDGGCPLYENESFMSMIYQAQTTLHWSVNTGVHANFEEVVIPKESITDGTARVTFSCDVFICTNNTRHRILGIPICSNTNLCRHGISIYENKQRIPQTVLRMETPVIEVDMTRPVERQIMDDPLFVPGPVIPKPSAWEQTKKALNYILVYIVPITVSVLVLMVVLIALLFLRRIYGPKICRFCDRVVNSALQRRTSRKRSEAHLQEPMTVPDDYDYDATIYPGDYLVDALPAKENATDPR